MNTNKTIEREEMRELLRNKDIQIINSGSNDKVTLENASDSQLLNWMLCFYGPTHHKLWRV